MLKEEQTMLKGKQTMLKGEQIVLKEEADHVDGPPLKEADHA